MSNSLYTITQLLERPKHLYISSNLLHNRREIQSVSLGKVKKMQEYKKLLKRDLNQLENEKARIENKLEKSDINKCEDWFEENSEQTKIASLLKQLDQVNEEINLKKDELGEL